MDSDELIEGPLTKSIIGAFYEVYNTLRYGFLEQHYSRALHLELESIGHRVAREVPARVLYKGQVIGLQKIDMVIDEKIVIEIKASEQLHPAGMRQLVSYMRASELPVGLLLHFGPEAKYYRRVQTSRADPEANT
ncbi:MAG TPA: GxxExxY protein [Gemmatimonadaceae bacterium]|nr:GxxExxY protein [Gemmatimonadaceae bacterium]